LALDSAECYLRRTTALSDHTGGNVPTYQYVCTACGQDLEAVQSFSDPALTECPACAGRLRKKFGSVGVVFKGSGFYRTDSRSGNGSASTAAASEKKDTAAASTGGSTESAEKKGSTSSEPKSSPGTSGTSNGSGSSSGKGAKPTTSSAA
jgi:putative FmdB family regulatory protein